jgi:hypothetical protein
MSDTALRRRAACANLPDMPTVPAPYTDCFHTPVLGTIFARRTEVVHRLHVGDRLILVPDPPGTDIPAVWVHAPGGDVIGHLPLQIAAWLAPWMLAGGRAQATVDKVSGDEVESWRRLLIEVRFANNG